MATPIINVTGIGAQTAKALEEYGFKTAEDIAVAKKSKLTKVPGFGPARSQNVIAAAKAVVGNFDKMGETAKKSEKKKKKKKAKKVKPDSKKTKKEPKQKKKAKKEKKKKK